MIEVTEEVFNEIISKRPYTTSFLLGDSAIRYNGKKGLLKGHCFAKRLDGKYYVDKIYVK